MVPTTGDSQTYRELLPAPELTGHLSCVWIQEVAPGAPVYLHRTIPNGAVELSCRIGDVPTVTGPQTGPTVARLAPGSVVVGVRFRPGAAPSVLGVPAFELVDLALTSEDLWGRAAVALGEQMAAARSTEQAAAILEAAVLARLEAAARPDALVGEAVRRLHAWGGDDVSALPSSLHISARQLRRRCHEAIGLAPKVIQRMLRFQGFLALAQLESGSDADLARLAAEAGYADQSHLTRESAQLAGSSPRALLLEAEEQCRDAHDHAASYEPLLRSRRAQRAA